MVMASWVTLPNQIQFLVNLRPKSLSEVENCKLGHGH